jgi:hypothetical protein
MVSHEVYSIFKSENQNYPADDISWDEITTGIFNLKLSALSPGGDILWGKILKGILNVEINQDNPADDISWGESSAGILDYKLHSALRQPGQPCWWCLMR